MAPKWADGSGNQKSDNFLARQGPEANIRELSIWTHQGIGPSHSAMSKWSPLLSAPASAPVFDWEGARGLLILAAAASSLRRTSHWGHSWARRLWGPGAHTQPSPGVYAPPPHMPLCMGSVSRPVPDPSDHYCCVVLLRFQWFSWPTGSPRSVAFFSKINAISEAKRGRSKWRNKHF